MLRSEAVETAQRLLSFRSDLASEILDELVNAQHRFERTGVPCPAPFTGVFRPEFLLSEMQEVPVEPEQERIPFPQDFLAESESDGFFRYDDVADKWYSLCKGETKSLRGAVDDVPSFYSVSGNYFRVFPQPQTIIYFRTIYYAAEPSFATTDIENKWLKYVPRLLIAEAAWHIAGALGYEAAAQRLAAMRSEEIRALFMSNETSLHVNQRYVMGGAN